MTATLVICALVIYCTAVLHHRNDEQAMELAFDHPGTPMPSGPTNVHAAREFTVAARDTVCDLVRKRERSTVS